MMVVVSRVCGGVRGCYGVRSARHVSVCYGVSGVGVILCVGVCCGVRGALVYYGVCGLYKYVMVCVVCVGTL